MDAVQQGLYAPGLGDQWEYPGMRQGQARQMPAAVPEQPVRPEEFGQQLRDMEALGARFPFWFHWFRERRWYAMRWTEERGAERIEGGSAAEIAARLGGGKPAPPEQVNPLATVPCPVLPAVEQSGERASPQVGQPWPPQAGTQHPPRDQLSRL
ncbi:hypothetical protein ACFRI7_25690 [Streptomyces sp. NPDC056716]|uniref:hypothetical protein n=1 Tax=unclassified Streptomyces TaxID=2593676 RepID=UPI0036B55297